MVVPVVGVEIVAVTPFVMLCPDDTDEVGIAIISVQEVRPQKSSHPVQDFIEQGPITWTCSTAVLNAATMVSSRC